MSEQNKTNTTPKPAVKTDAAAEWGAKISGWMADAAKLTAPIALLIIAIAIGVFASTQVYDLFTIHLSQPAFSAWLAVLSSVGIAYVMIITMKGWKHPSVQAASTLFAVGYVFIVFALVVLKWIFDAAIQTANITVQSVAQKVLETAPFLRDFGSLFVVALVGVGLACIAVLVATSKNPAEEFEHENRARSHLIGNTVKIIVSLTSIGLVVLFGYEVLKINIFVTVLLAVILDAGMINAYLRAESAARAGDHRQASVWRIWTAIYAGVVALVAVETVSHFAANSPDIAPAQKAMLNSGVFNILKDIGLLALCGAVGLSVVQLVVLLFSYTNQRRDEDIESGRYTPPAKKGVTLPWRGRVSKPAPVQTQLAQDGTKGALPAGITLADDGPQLEAWRDGDKFAWSVKRGGAVVASGKADTMDAAKAAANQAGGVSTQTVDDDGWKVQNLTQHPGGKRYWRFVGKTLIDVVELPNRKPNWTMEDDVGVVIAERESESVPEAKTAAYAAAREHNSKWREPVKGKDYDETWMEVSPAEADDLMRRHREMLDREAQRPKN